MLVPFDGRDPKLRRTVFVSVPGVSSKLSTKTHPFDDTFTNEGEWIGHCHACAIEAYGDWCQLQSLKAEEHRYCGPKDGNVTYSFQGYHASENDEYTERTLVTQRRLEYIQDDFEELLPRARKAEELYWDISNQNDVVSIPNFWERSKLNKPSITELKDNMMTEFYHAMTGNAMYDSLGYAISEFLMETILIAPNRSAEVMLVLRESEIDDY